MTKHKQHNNDQTQTTTQWPNTNNTIMTKHKQHNNDQTQTTQ